jgi:hypothetical protein
LESSSDAAVECAVARLFAIISRQLGLRVYWGHRRFAIGHSCALQDIFSVLRLCEEEAIPVPANLNTKEKVQVIEILDGEDLTQLIDNLA